MIHAVIDTNVIVSAHITKKLNAATSKVWESVLQGNLIPIYNEEILEARAAFSSLIGVVRR